MRIGCLQFSPQVGDTENNLNRADAVLSKATPDDLDLLVLPELAFSGYNFKSLQHIMPFLEPSGSGITSLWARTMALKYNCTVTVGYPEKVDVSSNWPTGPEYYNSTIVVNGEGETIANYRKRFLYYTDESWALEGTSGFYDGWIPGLGNTSIGICMDLNPYKFEAPWHAFEFAFHVLEVESNLVILSMAWMTRQDRRRFTRMPNEPDMETLTYWVTRLEPLIRSDNRDEIIVIFCNRTGVEDDVTYTGTSAVIGVLDGEVKVYGLLGRGEKELLVVDTNKAPYAKLVHRPSEQGAPTHPGLLTEPGDNALHHQGRKETGEAPSNDSHSPPDGGPNTDNTSTRSPSQKKRAAPIIVPKAGMMASSKSPTMDYNIPTPSAPSPTPMAVRPKLIIPTSPPISPQQTSSDWPNSASSAHSARSYRSEDSEASVQTVRSNPRPPEDSTPYPHTSAPLSGYPENRWDARKQIYGGNVTISHFESLSPTTPFEDTSPVSVRHFWRPPEYPTPVGRRPEPFPWSEITGQNDGDNTEDPHLSQGKRQQMQQQSTTKSETSPRSVKPPAPNTQSSRSSPSMASHPSAGHVTQPDRFQGSPRVDPRSYRPSSPKSRNASRPSFDEQSGQVFKSSKVDANPSTTTNGSQDTRRVESANSMRGTVTQPKMQDTAVERPSSPKSRNCSRSRPNDSEDFFSADPHTIPIVASPSIFRGGASTPEAKGLYRPLTRANFRQHSRSLSHSGTAPGSRSETPPKTKPPTIPRTTSRPASRGRQREPKDAEAPAPERASSKDSITNNELHTRIDRHESRDSRRVSQSGRLPSRSSSQQTPLAHYERIEVVSCSNCPVHGQHSDSSVDDRSDMESDQERKLHLGSVSCSTQSPTLNAHSEKTPTQRKQPDAFAEKTMKSDSVTSEASRTPEGNMESTEYASSSEIAQTSSSGRSPATPSNFDPPTPKAMAFNTNDIPLASAHPNDTAAKDVQLSTKVL